MPYALIEGFEDEATATHLSFSAADSDFSEVAGEDRGFALQRDSGAGLGNVLHTEGITGFGSVLSVVLGCRVYRDPTPTSTSGDVFLAASWSGTTRRVELGLRPNGVIYANGTNVTDPSPSLSDTIPSGEWSYIEIAFHYVAGTGSVDYFYYVNGSLVQSGEGATAGFGDDFWDGGFDNAYFGIDGESLGYRFDDLYMWVSTSASAVPPTVNGVSFPFGKRLHVDRLLPDATGALTDWGGAYTDVDDDDPTTSTGTSVTSSTSTHQASYSVEALPGTVEAVLAVQYDLWGQGSVNVEPLWRSSGGSVGTSTTDLVSLPSTWGGARAILDQNPQTASDWTVSDVGTGEFGFELE